MTPFSLALRPRIAALKTISQALVAPQATLAGMRVQIPGSLAIRLSVVMGNLRMQRMFDTLLSPGETVVDAGANIGYNSLYAAYCVGRHGRVYAIEPAQDNLTILYTNLFANHLNNIIVLPYAAGSKTEIKEFYLRGEVSAVNSLFQDNFYAGVTETVKVLAVPLDDLIPGRADLVKIDVEGGELEVLEGMRRMLKSPPLRLIVEWHPVLQQAAGHAADALPRYLAGHGFTLTAVSHTSCDRLDVESIPALAAKLLRKRTPVELLATR
jgi:FkbM family methyltransferase